MKNFKYIEHTDKEVKDIKKFFFLLSGFFLIVFLLFIGEDKSALFCVSVSFLFLFGVSIYFDQKSSRGDLLSFAQDYILIEGKKFKYTDIENIGFSYCKGLKFLMIRVKKSMLFPFRIKWEFSSTLTIPDGKNYYFSEKTKKEILSEFRKHDVLYQEGIVGNLYNIIMYIVITLLVFLVPIFLIFIYAITE